MDASTKPEQQEQKEKTQQAQETTTDMAVDIESKKRPSELAVEEENAKVSHKKQEVGPASANDKPHEEKDQTDAAATAASATTEARSSSSGGDKKQVSSSRDVNDPESKPFGGRILTDEANVFEQNAWYDYYLSGHFVLRLG
jgi:tRNAThr (cytosine32-N3)-methyltransferase